MRDCRTRGESLISTSDAHSLLRGAFRETLQRCTVEAAVARAISIDDGMLKLGAERLDLRSCSEVLIVSAGKAGTTLFDAVTARLPQGLSVRAVVSSPTPPARRAEDVQWFAGGHPQPNAASIQAARAALKLFDQGAPDALVLFLISGGASAMFELPLCESVTLDEMVALNQLLLASGARIGEVNCIRKHLSAVKGGRLALAAGSRSVRTLLVSDVPRGELDALGSGPTVSDTSTLEDFTQLLRRYALKDLFPDAYRRCVDAGLPETPKSLAVDVKPTVLLDNEAFLEQMSEWMQSHGYDVVIDCTCDDWDYEAASRYLLERAAALRNEGRRVCLLSGGEVTVRLPVITGIGGRNQHFALYCATQPEVLLGGITVLSAGTDGIDGHSSAAGAVADATTLSRGHLQGLDADMYLLRFDAGSFFAALGDAIVTGPSGNNLRDVRAFLIEP